MVQEPSILGKNFIFLVQTKDKALEQRLTKLVTGENLRLELVEHSEHIEQQLSDGQIVTFIIGSDVEDPIQSAQRFHAFKERAKIIILSKSQNVESLKETIKFAPFIGTEVFCLDQSKEAKLEKRVRKILHDSLKTEKYRDVIAESNSKISLKSFSQKSAFNQTFISKLMDVAPIGITIVSREGKILGWNKEAALIFEKNETQVLGKPLTHHFGSTEGNKLVNYLRECFEEANPGSIDSLSLERERQDSSKQFLDFTAAPFSLSEETKKALILAFKDVTKRIQAQKELQNINETLEERVKERTDSLLSYQKQLRRLASQLSKAEEKERRRLATELHDNLGQILSVGKMKVDILQKDHFSEETTSAINELNELMDDAINYTRKLMSDLKPPPTLDKEDIKATIKWLAKQMEKRGLEVHLDDDNQSKRVSKDIRTTLLQCVRELLFNIIRHTQVNEARISISRPDTHVQIIVEDEGPGFEPDMIESASTEEGRFGLFNIRERMDFIGGNVEIYSEPGEGTKVKLIAPLKENDQQQISTEDEAVKDQTKTAKSTQKVKVLLVDDHKMMREGLRKIVNEQEDLTVTGEASDGKEAIELAREKNPDIIVMDVNMPVMDGIEATQKIVSTMSDIRVIGLSLHDNQELIDNMRSAGASAYLSKNEAFKTLSATIRSEANK